jgi:N utilization substance protein A
MQIVVPDDQLSLAIGRKGQNVRLAAQFSGWKIDITSETKVAEEKEVAWASLSRIEGLSEILVQTLYNHGFRRANDIIDADAEMLGSLPGFTPDAIPRLKESALNVVSLESEERGQRRERAREYARVLLAIEAFAEKELAEGRSDESRLAGLDGVADYVLARLKEANYGAPEDLYYEEDPEHLVEMAGFSPGKARQIRYSAAEYLNQATGGIAPVNEKPLAEPEIRDAELYDELNAGGGEASAVDAPDAESSAAGMEGGAA